MHCAIKWFAALAVAVQAPLAAAEETAQAARGPATNAGVAAAPSPAGRGPDPRIIDARARTAALDLAGGTVQTELLRARQRSDAPRAACLDEMLTRLHVAARTGRLHLERIRDALSAGNAEAAELERVKLDFLVERTTRLAREAAQCGDRFVAGAPSGRSNGATSVRVFAPTLPDAAAYPQR